MQLRAYDSPSAVQIAAPPSLASWTARSRVDEFNFMVRTIEYDVRLRPASLSKGSLSIERIPGRSARPFDYLFMTVSQSGGVMRNSKTISYEESGFDIIGSVEIAES